MSPIRSRRLAAAVVVAAALLPLLPLFLLRHLPAGRDQPDFFLPIAAETAARLRAGDLPLWNPRSFAGEPWLATVQPGALSPSAIPYALLPFPDAHRICLLLYRLLLTIGLYRLARRVGAGRMAAAGAVLVAALGPSVASAAAYDNNFRTLAFGPFVLLSAIRLRRGRPAGAVGLGITLALAFLGGEPQLAAICAALAAVIVLSPGAALPLRARAARLFVASSLAPLLAAPTLFPFLELVRLSDRGSGLGAAESLRESARPLEILAILVGAPLGTPAGGFAVPGRQSYLALPVLGAASGLLAVAGAIVVGRRRAARPLLAFGIVLLLASTALRYLPADWATRLPVRYPVRFLLPLLVLGAPVLVAIGLSRLAAGDRKLLLFAGSGAIVASIAFLPLAVDRTPLYLAFLSIAALLLAAGMKVRVWTTVLAILVAAAEARGLSARIEAPHAPEAELLSPPPLVELLAKREPAGRILPEAPTERLLTLPIFGGRPVSPPERVRLFGFGYSPLLGSARSADGGGPMILRRFDLLRSRSAAPDGIRLVPLYAASGFVSADHPDLSGITEVSSIGAVRAFTWNGALPRDLVVFDWKPVPDAPTALELLASGEVDPQRSATVEPPEKVVLPAPPTISGPRWKVIRLLADLPERRLLRIESSHPGLLVVADSWYPGWTARVGGREVPILVADAAFRGIFVPAGTSVVEMTYEPASFRTGLIAAVVGLVLAVLSLAMDARSLGRAA